MKKNGFTLIEVMGVIIVLSIIGLIATIAINITLKQNKERLYNIQINNIELGVKNWSAEQIFNMPEKEGEAITITLWQLKQAGFVDLDIKNPMTSLEFPNDMLITITLKNNTYVYEVLKDSGSVEFIGSYNPNSPTILLNGLGIVDINYVAGSADYYNDPGIVAKTSTGEIISEVNIEIKKDDQIVQNIPLNTLGTYIIKYTVSDKGITVSVRRTVNII